MPCKSAYDSGEIHLTDEQQKAYDGLLEDYKAVRVRLHFFTALPEAAKHQFI